MSGLSDLFLDPYTKMVAQRAALTLAPLQPVALTNFQFGPEYLEQEQVAPRIVLVPKSSEFSFSQPNPAMRNPATAQPVAKSLYTEPLAFEAHIWGEPDPNATDTSYSFDTTRELMREFIGAMYTKFMGGRGPAAGFTPTGGEWRTDPRGVGMVNTYGRLYVLNFTLSLQVQRDAYVTIPYAVTHNDGGVEREIVRDITDPVNGSNPVVIPPTIEVP